MVASARRRRSPHAAGVLRVASYNVHGCVGLDGRYSPDRILQVLCELRADVAGLQEVDSRAGPHADAFAVLAARSGMHAVAGPNIRTARGAYGNLLLSRWPPVAVRRIDLSVRGRERRGALDVDLRTPGGMLRVVVTHLGLRASERRAQLAVLRAALASRAAPAAVVLGDFNISRPRGPELFAVAAPVRRLPPRTFPSWLPLLALDRIVAAPPAALSPPRAHGSALSRRASDHLPLIAELCLPDDDPPAHAADAIQTMS